jgi:hypothetical protein
VNYNGFPSLDDIYQNLERLADKHSDVARVESLGVSAEGRDIKAVYVTDGSVPASEKEVAVVICGRHGQEFGTRVVGNALLEWLSSEEGAETRRRQIVIIVPVANPDGCVRGEFFAPGDGLSEAEQNTIAELARIHQPDAVIDIHSLGGSDVEFFLTANTSGSGEDVFIHRKLAAKMVEDTAQQGYPFSVRAVKLSSGYNNFLCEMYYENFHSLAFGMEVNHLSLSPEEAAESGVAAVRSLLSAGNARWSWEPHSGYPNRILMGNFFTAIRAAGCNAAERRESRSKIWQNRKLFTVPSREILDRHTVKVSTKYSGESLSCKFSLCCRVRGFPTVKKARLNEEDVEIYTYKDKCSTYVCVDIQPSAEEEYEFFMEL